MTFLGRFLGYASAGKTSPDASGGVLEIFGGLGGVPKGVKIESQASKRRFQSASVVRLAREARSEGFSLDFQQFSTRARKGRTLISTRPYRGFAGFSMLASSSRERARSSKSACKNHRNRPPDRPQIGPRSSKIDPRSPKIDPRAAEIRPRSIGIAQGSPKKHARQAKSDQEAPKSATRSARTPQEAPKSANEAPRAA